MRALEVILVVLCSGQVETPDTPKEILRRHLHGELASSRMVLFDVLPLSQLRSQSDLVRALIEILQEEGKSAKRIEEMMAAVSILDQYQQQFSDPRIPPALRSISLDSNRPFVVRHNAAQRRGRMAGPETPAFFAEIFENHPDLAGPLNGWLRVLAAGQRPDWMSVKEFYTPEVRDALRKYVDGRLKVTPFATDRKMYMDLIADLDRQAGFKTEGGTIPETPPSGRNPAVPAKPEAGSTDSSTKDPVQTPAPGSESRGSGRMIAAAVLAAGVIGILAFRFLRRK